jgi:hypothetical protein
MRWSRRVSGSTVLGLRLEFVLLQQLPTAERPPLHAPNLREMPCVTTSPLHVS